MNQAISKPVAPQYEVFETEGGLMAIKFEPSMGMSEILRAFGTLQAHWPDAGRELLSRNKFKMSGGELQREDGRSISPRTLIYMPKKYVTPKSAPDTDRTVSAASPATTPTVEKSKGLLAEYQAEFRELMKDRNARIAIYSAATLAVAVTISSAVAVALYATPTKKPSRTTDENRVELVQEEEDEEGEGEKEEVKRVATLPVPPASDANALAESEEEVSPKVATPTSSPISPVSAASSGQFVFSSKTSAADLKAAIAEMNAQSRRGP